MFSNKWLVKYLKSKWCGVSPTVFLFNMQLMISPADCIREQMCNLLNVIMLPLPMRACQRLHSGQNADNNEDLNCRTDISFFFWNKSARIKQTNKKVSLPSSCSCSYQQLSEIVPFADIISVLQLITLCLIITLWTHNWGHLHSAATSQDSCFLYEWFVKVTTKWFPEIY